MFQGQTKPNQGGGKEVFWSLEANLTAIYRITAKDVTDMICTQLGLFVWSCATCANRIREYPKKYWFMKEA